MQAISQQLLDTRTALAPVAGDAAALEARVLAGHAWSMTPEELVKHANEPRETASLQLLVNRRLQHEPVSHIVGMKEFWRDTFMVTADVLTPRADTETMLEALLRHQQASPARILDLGTGSGCLLLSALREYPQATGVGVDQSEAALAVAAKNAAALGMAERAAFVRSNWCSALEGRFDVLLSNPPYIPTGDIAGLDRDVQGYEPHTALDGGADGLACYRSILQQAGAYLNPRSLVIFEVGMGQAQDVAALGQDYGFTFIEISADLAGIGRVVVLQTK